MPHPASELVIDPVLVRKYDASGPRYTSYPTADRFVEAFGEEDLRRWMERRTLGAAALPLSLYVHLPFCATVCYYCGCNKIATRDRSRGTHYVRDLARELELLGPLLGNDRRLCQLHWGGGTPNFLAREDAARLMGELRRRFDPEPGMECSIEIDPRELKPGDMAFLAEQGFNRVSIGVQDFDPAVQEAVNRVQPEAVTRAAVAGARDAGMRSVNLDLIYGLPLQTLDSFNRTLDQVIDLAPDRIALYSYAHLPAVFKPQRRIDQAALPSPETKLQILTLAIGRLIGAGYLYIGMDHFARPEDELAVAQRRGQLQRNFQGYSTRPEADQIGLGLSSIGRIGPTYYQNAKRMDDYRAALAAGRLPVMRGIELKPDDLVRRAVIQALMCQFRVSMDAIGMAHLVDFRRYFAPELAELRAFADDGLVELDEEWIKVTPRGRLLVRAVCAVFDRYLRERAASVSYSRVI